MKIRSLGIEAAASSPIDQQAAKMLRGGIAFQPDLKQVPMHVHSSLPLPWEAFHGPSQFDITGQVFGQLVVLGVWSGDRSKKDRKDKKRTWVVKCSCGAYSRRKRKSLINPAEPEKSLKCRECQHLDTLRSR